MKVDRRAMLTGAAALSVAPLTTSAFAAAPPVRKQAPGYYRYKVGEFEVTALSDGARDVKFERSPYSNAKLEDVQAELDSKFKRIDQAPVPFTTNLINTGNKLVLIDTGNGAGRDPNTGHVAANMAAASVDPATIDLVVISHFHGDHITGLLTTDGKPAYPNAEVKVPAREWAFWMDESNRAKAPEGSNLAATHANVRRVFGALGEKVSRYEWNTEVTPGIRSMDTNGHTPGHTSFMVTSGNASLLVQSDVVSHVAILFMRNPQWFGSGDMDGPQAVATRRKVLDMVANDRLLMTSYHLPFPATGYVEKDGTGYRFQPAPWNPTI